jgi:hypothetical protein
MDSGAPGSRRCGPDLAAAAARASGSVRGFGAGPPRAGSRPRPPVGSARVRGGGIVPAPGTRGAPPRASSFLRLGRAGRRSDPGRSGRRSRRSRRGRLLDRQHRDAAPGMPLDALDRQGCPREADAAAHAKSARRSPSAPSALLGMRAAIPEVVRHLPLGVMGTCRTALRNAQGFRRRRMPVASRSCPSANNEPAPDRIARRPETRQGLPICGRVPGTDPLSDRSRPEDGEVMQGYGRRAASPPWAAVQSQDRRHLCAISDRRRRSETVVETEVCRWPSCAVFGGAA